ncbi:hypothetical protein TNCV_438391 [Trichonephila clavipes]|nr:hypothetical protein TNCV_438391 [Trichonephila clavipes]
MEILKFGKIASGSLAADGSERKILRTLILLEVVICDEFPETPVTSVEDLNAPITVATGRIRDMPGIFQNVRHDLYTTESCFSKFQSGGGSEMVYGVRSQSAYEVREKSGNGQIKSHGVVPKDLLAKK